MEKTFKRPHCKSLGTRLAVLPVLFYTLISTLWTDAMKPILELEGGK